jgi:hypothetical protein
MLARRHCRTQFSPAEQTCLRLLQLLSTGPPPLLDCPFSEDCLRLIEFAAKTLPYKAKTLLSHLNLNKSDRHLRTPYTDCSGIAFASKSYTLRALSFSIHGNISLPSPYTSFSTSQPLASPSITDRPPSSCQFRFLLPFLERLSYSIDPPCTARRAWRL